MPPLPIKAKKMNSFSPYNGTLMAHENEIEDGIIDPQDLIIKYTLLPLYNVRMLPLFHQTQFNHPIAPLVDLKQGFSCVFTLNIYLTEISQLETNYDENKNINIMLHEQSQFYRYE